MRTQAEQLLGARVTCSDGKVIGTIEQIFRDDVDGTPAWARVRSGKSSRFVPLGTSQVTGEGLRVPFDSPMFMNSPDIEAGQHMSAAQCAELSRFYGLTIPSQQAPREQTPGQQVPSQQVPTQEAAAPHVSGQQPYAEQPYGQETRSEQIPTQEAAAPRVSGQQIPGQEAPRVSGQQIPGQEAPRVSGQQIPGQEAPRVSGQQVPSQQGTGMPTEQDAAYGRTTVRAEQLLGARVACSDGKVIGTVEQVFRDDVDGTPAWARIRSGKTSRFVPLGTSQVTGEGLRVPIDSPTVMNSPDIDAGLHISAAQAEQLSRFYGLTIPPQQAPG
jgi:sporulation protein YlmC with PRC-barrel domain